MDKNKAFICACGKSYTQQPNLSRHRKTCNTKETQNLQEQINVPLTIQTQKQIQTLQSENIKLQEQLKTLQEQMYQDQIKILKEQLQLYQKREQPTVEQQTTTVQEKFLAVEPLVLPRELNGSRAIESLIPPRELCSRAVESEILPKEKPKQINKKPSVKSYLATCNPITYTNFMINYIPTIEDYLNIIKYRSLDGTVKNIINYLSKYDKKQFPIVITNSQRIRIRIIVYDKISETENKWKIIKGNDAIKFLHNMIELFVFKLHKYKLKVFNVEYPGIDDILHPDREDHCIKSCQFNIALRTSDHDTNNVMNAIMEYFLIIENIEETEEFEIE
jgi:hypothetical protein